MTRWKAMAIASCVGLLGVAFLPSSRADEWNKKTVLTVNEPLLIPGATLQPGKYVIKLADSQSNRHIVQVFSEDESQLITTVLAIPNYRLQPTGESQFGYWEMPSGQARALRSWFYPGDNFGQEFAFPKEQAQQIAKAAQQPVPAVVSEGTDASSADVKRITPEGQQEEITTSEEAAKTEEKTTETAQVQPQPEVQAQPQTETQTRTDQSAQAQQPTTQQPATQQPTTDQGAQADQTTAAQPAQAPAAERLPATASPFPMIGLAGLLAMGAALAVRAVSKHLG